MPWPIYSKRFLATAGQNGASSATVPPSRVWILKNITASNNTSSALVATIAVGNTYIMYASIQGNATTNYAGMHVVLNAGETMTINQPTGMHVIVSGYELLS